MTKRHDNWRTLGDILPDVLRSAEIQEGSVDARPVKDGERPRKGRAARPSNAEEGRAQTLGMGKSRTPKRPAKLGGNKGTVKAPVQVQEPSPAPKGRPVLRVVVDNGRGEPIAKPSKRGRPRLVAIGSPLALRAVH